MHVFIFCFIFGPTHVSVGPLYSNDNHPVANESCGFQFATDCHCDPMMHVRTDVALLVSLLSGAHAFALAPAASPSTVGVNVRAAASMAALPATTDVYEWATFQFDENGKAKRVGGAFSVAKRVVPTSIAKTLAAPLTMAPIKQAAK